MNDLLLGLANDVCVTRVMTILRFFYSDVNKQQSVNLDESSLNSNEDLANFKMAVPFCHLPPLSLLIICT